MARPGEFCWPELATSDQKAGVAFYNALFGWHVTDQPIGPNMTYSLFDIGGRSVGAASTQMAEEAKMAPPNWHVYVCVASADAAATRATELGGTVLMGPFDAMDQGRMAIIVDPTGGVFSVWEPKKHPGADLIGEVGSLCWTELSTRDTKKAEAFYTQLFGWVPKHSPAGSPMEYTEFSVEGKPSIGMMAMPEMVPAEVGAFWLTYFRVTDVDASASKAMALGATTLVPPSDIANAGRFSVLQDPQGAAFAVFAPRA